MNRRNARPTSQMVRQMAVLIASTTMIPQTLALSVAKKVAENPPTAKQINNIASAAGSGAKGASSLSKLWSSAGKIAGSGWNTASSIYGGGRNVIGGIWQLGKVGKDAAVFTGYGIQVWIVIAIIMLIMGSIYKIALMRKKAKALNIMQNVSGTVTSVAKTAVNLAQTGANVAKRGANIVVSRSEKLAAHLAALEDKLYNPNKILSNTEVASLEKRIARLQRELGGALQDCGTIVERLQNGADRVIGGNGGARLLRATAQTTTFILGESRREASNLNKPGTVQKAIVGAGQAVAAVAATGASGGGLLLAAAAGAGAGMTARQASPRRQASPPRLTNARRQASPRRRSPNNTRNANNSLNNLLRQFK